MLPESLQKYPVAQDLLAGVPDAIIDGHDRLNEVTLYIDPGRIVDVCRFLKDQRTFVRISSITAVDWIPAEPRFEVVYHLHSLERNERLRLKCRLSGENPEIDSVTGVWRGADWYEREVFDLFGIRFRNHPNLKRILMPEDWEGYPLRKDYPVPGGKYIYQHE
jgi:NADH-quinone oxidoreductase subunit C